MRFNHCISYAVLIISISAPGTVFADHASASFETGSAGAIMTIPGATLPQGNLVAGFGVHFIELDDLSDARLEALGAAEEDVHSVDSLLQFNASVAYGLSNDLTLGASLPYIDRYNVREAHHDLGMGEAELAGDSGGIGDIRLFAQYRFYKGDMSDIALLAGVKAPTGDTDERELEGGLFEIEQQPGTGSWDPFAGLSFNQELGRAGISANFLYTVSTEGDQQTELGDIFNYNLALSWRAYSPEGGHDHHHHTNTFNIVDYMDLAIELNGDVRGHVEIAGEEEKNSGGHIVYLSPGVRIGLAHRVSLFSSLGIPVLNDLNGVQSEPDFRVIGGISIRFD